MTTIELQFLANRYHGTAWGRHVNEGVAEWPPSPYRLLRAMYDAWKRKCDELSKEAVRRVFEALASAPPQFRLPKAVAAHTRSYLNSNTESPSDKSLIFDGFVALNPSARCFLEWDVELGAEERLNLETLLGSLNYLGRSESWVEARLVDAAHGMACKPASEGSKDVAYVACPMPVAEYRGKQAWLDALAYSSGTLLKEKLSGPPAMRYVPYELPQDAVTTWLPVRPEKGRKQLSAAILELHGKVLPPVTDGVRVAERVRGRLMKHFERIGLPVPPMVHGKDEMGAPLREKHLHLFILPRANRLGRIDHVLLYTRHDKGFGIGVADAIAQLQNIVWIERMRATASWLGSAQDRQVRPLARVVKSSTPFVTARHWRKGRIDFIEREIRRECENHDLPPPVRVEEDQTDLQVHRFRRNREGDPTRNGYAYEIEFPHEVQTPFALGYGCHFGLGQFEKIRV